MSVTLPPPLTAPTDNDAVALLREYYGQTYLDSGCYTGAYFDSWAPRTRQADADRFTADDLVAVTFLSVDIGARAARELLVTRADEFAELLAAVGPDHELVDDADALTRDSPLWRLEAELLSIKDIGRTKATKLMARKRPQLVPIYDVVVGKVLGTTLSHPTPFARRCVPTAALSMPGCVRSEQGRVCPTTSVRCASSTSSAGCGASRTEGAGGTPRQVRGGAVQSWSNTRRTSVCHSIPTPSVHPAPGRPVWPLTTSAASDGSSSL